MYENAFSDVMGMQQELVFQDVAWHADEIKNLAEALSFTKQLILLDLTGNPFRAQGVGALSATLPTCAHLRFLYLALCQVGDDGMQVLCPVLPQLHKLEELNLSDNGITGQGAVLLFEELPRCPRLWYCVLNDNPLGGTAATDAMVTELRRCKSLQALYMENCNLDGSIKQARQSWWAGSAQKLRVS